jgi:hypothetical protein
MVRPEKSDRLDKNDLMEKVIDKAPGDMETMVGRRGNAEIRPNLPVLSPAACHTIPVGGFKYEEFMHIHTSFEKSSDACLGRPSGGPDLPSSGFFAQRV